MRPEILFSKEKFIFILPKRCNHNREGEFFKKQNGLKML